jgi:hypothetical protein
VRRREGIRRSGERNEMRRDGRLAGCFCSWRSRPVLHARSIPIRDEIFFVLQCSNPDRRRCSALRSLRFSPPPLVDDAKASFGFCGQSSSIDLNYRAVTAINCCPSVYTLSTMQTSSAIGLTDSALPTPLLHPNQCRITTTTSGRATQPPAKSTTVPAQVPV